MSRSPAFRFYPSDFWGSPDVQAMDLHEVGAYLSLMSAAWLSERPGCLPDDDEKLRRWARMTRDQWAQSREVLLSKFPTLEAGIRANPRLYREAEKQLAFSASQSAKGRKGGRPKAGNKPELSTNKPELSVGLSPEKPSVSVSVSVLKQEQKLLSVQKPETPKVADHFLEAWNSNRGNLPKVQKLTVERRKKISARVAEGLSVESFTEVVKLAARTPFCRGESRGERKWKCDFDFIIANETNLLKIVEGKYGDPDKPKTVFVEVPAEQWLGGPLA